MGVDYDANFGIGIYIDEEQFKDKDNSEIGEYLDNLLNGSKCYKWSQVGDGAYTGEKDDFIITMLHPLRDSYNISAKVIDMELFLKENNIKFDRIDEVGGLLVW